MLIKALSEVYKNNCRISKIRKFEYIEKLFLLVEVENLHVVLILFLFICFLMQDQEC